MRPSFSAATVPVKLPLRPKVSADGAMRSDCAHASLTSTEPFVRAQRASNAASSSAGLR